MEIFKAWPKIPRVENRKEFYTEKIDGTNACVIILRIPIEDLVESGTVKYKIIEDDPNDEFITHALAMFIQSRSRLITPQDDNYGFAKWAVENFDELIKLGEGYHYGEWWGKGIQRGYGLNEKRFSLFNTKRWGDHNPNTPVCVSVVPTIQANTVEEAKQKLIENGSYAAPGFMNVEGVVVYEYNTDSYWKAIINK